MYDWSQPETFDALLATRRSVGLYEENIPLARETISALITAASKAPSAYNLQNWKFIAVQSPDGKTRLQEAAYGQPQIGSASATIIIVGLMDGYRELANNLRPAQAEGIVPASVARNWVDAARDTHENNTQLRRDEAIRSASLAAMCLMLAAEARGLATGAMSGFDAAAVQAAFDLQSSELPVMLITVGQARAGAWPQKPRRPASEILAFA